MAIIFSPLESEVYCTGIRGQYCWGGHHILSPGEWSVQVSEVSTAEVAIILSPLESEVYCTGTRGQYCIESLCDDQLFSWDTVVLLLGLFHVSGLWRGTSRDWVQGGWGGLTVQCGNQNYFSVLNCEPSGTMNDPFQPFSYSLCGPYLFGDESDLAQQNPPAPGCFLKICRG